MGKLLSDIDSKLIPRINVTQKFAHSPHHHVICAPTKSEVAMFNASDEKAGTFNVSSMIKEGRCLLAININNQCRKQLVEPRRVQPKSYDKFKTC